MFIIMDPPKVVHSSENNINTSSFISGKAY